MTKLIDLHQKQDFIIAELDDHHLFVDESKIQFVREHIQKFQDEKNRYHESYQNKRNNLELGRSSEFQDGRGSTYGAS